MAKSALKLSRRERSADFEARTGQTVNMREAGWQCMTRRESTGQPNRYEKAVGHRRFRIVLGLKDIWRAEELTLSPGCRWVRAEKIKSPVFAGPVALACWLAVEISNETVRYDT